MIEVTVIGSWALVVLGGEFDVSNADQIRSVAAELSAQTITDVTIDLSRVTFIGAAGIAALLDAERLCSSFDGRMVLVGASAVTQRVFRLAGVGQSFPLVDLPLLSPPATAPAGVGDDELIGLLAEVSRLLLTEAAVTADLHAVVRAAVDLVPGCQAASIAVVARSESRTAAVTDQTAVEVDVAQYVTGEGPCLEAARSVTDRIRFDAGADDGRFVRFAPLAGKLGIRAVLSVPVVLRDVTIASVNLYSSAPLDGDADAMGWVIAAQVAAALAKSEIYTAALAVARRFQERADDERDVNIAAGVLAGFEDCSIDQAQALLRSPALTGGGSVVAAAQRVISYLGGSAPSLL